jgi:hypothetical protein
MDFKNKKSNGLAVDSSGEPVADPTINVLSLVSAAVNRLDDLRMAESRRVDEQAALRSHYEDLLTLAEAKRIDANRAGDGYAVSVASQRASDQAGVLANQVSQTAEAMRGIVASASVSASRSQQELGDALSKRIAALEESKYKGEGKQSYSDPQIISLIEETKGLRAAQNLVKGKSEGLSLGWSIILGLTVLSGFVLTLINVAISIWKMTH